MNTNLRCSCDNVCVWKVEHSLVGPDSISREVTYQF